MEDTYYRVRQRVHPSLHLCSSVFVRISEGRLEHITGDQIIFSLLELKDGKPKMSDRAMCDYDFYLLSKKQCDFQIAIAEGRKCGSGDVRTYRNPANKVIMVGERI